MFRKFRFAATLLFSISFRSYALQPLITDDTHTQGRGGRQLEIALTHARTRQGGATDRALSLPCVLTYGMYDTLDISASGTKHYLDPATGARMSGTGNPVLGAKYRFYANEPDAWSLAAKPEISLPVSRNDEASGLGTGETAYTVSLLAERDTGSNTTLVTLSAIHKRYRDPLLDQAARTRQYSASVAELRNFATQWQLAVESGIFTQEDRHIGSPVYFAQLAAIFSPGTDTALAVGLKRDFASGGISTWITTLGLTYHF